MAVFTGTAGNDVQNGTTLADEMFGLDGDDIINGDDGGDHLEGGAGADTLDGGAGDDHLSSYLPDQYFYEYRSNTFSLDIYADVDTLIGGLGADYFAAGAGDNVDGGGDYDVLYLNFQGATSGVTADFGDLYTVGSLTVAGGLIQGIEATPRIVGSEYDDVLTPHSDGYWFTAVWGMGGNDHLTAAYYTTELYGGEGDDLLDGHGSQYLNQVSGGEGDDTIIGNALGAAYYGDAGHDDMTAGGVMHGGDGNDTIRLQFSYYANTSYGGAGDDHLSDDGAGSWASVFHGEDGDDVLDGEGGADTLYGGAGSDILIGGAGADLLDGGADVDFADYRTASGAISVNMATLKVTGAAQTDTLVSIEVIYGSAYGDTMTAAGAATGASFHGFAGADTLVGGAWADNLAGGEGDDSIDGGDGVDAIHFATLGSVTVDLSVVTAQNTGEGLDTIVNVEDVWGFGGDDTLSGDSAANFLFGNYGDDTLNGRDGDDTLVGGHGADTIRGGAGADVIHGANNYGPADDGPNTLFGESGFDLIYGGDGADEIYGGAGNDTLAGLGGADLLAGGIGADTYVVDNAGVTLVEAADQGVDTVRTSLSHVLAANFENLTLTGDAAVGGQGNDLANTLTGNGAVNVLKGWGGDDVLDGGVGRDALYGGLGDDTFIVDHSAERIYEHLGEGTDTVRSSVNLTLSANVENLVLTGTAALNGTGNELANVITGNNGANILRGGAGDDALSGGRDNDLLDGGLGDDILQGGLGNDTFVVDSSLDQVVELAGQGIDLVLTDSSYTLGDHLENLTLTGAAVAGGGNALNNVLTGNGAANVLTGEAGHDRLVGGAGDDQMSGGTGDDVFVVDSLGDQVIENAGEGTDTVESSVGWTLADDLERLTLTGVAAINGTGNGAANILTGNAAANQLFGEAGADILYGGGGHDRLDGGLDNDKLAGGAGNDTYLVDSGGDKVSETLGEGVDLIEASVSYALSANVENLVLTGSAANGTGNDLANVLTGNDAANRLIGAAGADQLTGAGGSDRLDGGAGADKMYGGVGDDIYVIDDAGDLAVEGAGAGTDTVEAWVSATLGSNIENLVLMGAAAINGAGNALDNTVTGNAAANILLGLGGSDRLYGGAGGDRLDGGSGYDDMRGGLDDDVYVVDSLGDQILEKAGEGVDTVESRVSWTLAANLENLTLTGAAAVNATGNDAVNILIGNDAANWLSGAGGFDTLNGGGGNDRLDGGAGFDNMAGGLGDDTYIVDSGGDHVAEAFNAGIDSVEASVTYTLTSSVENLTLTGSGEIDGSGNGLANVIVGNTAANIIHGAGGADTLSGGAGDDTFRYAMETESLAGASDLITDFAAGDRIDLSAIDAIADLAGGDDAFVRVAGDGAFTAAGQLRLVLDGGQTRLELNTDADLDAEMVILLSGNHTSDTAEDGWLL